MVNEGAKVVWPMQEKQVKVPKAKRFSLRNASFLPSFLLKCTLFVFALERLHS